VIDDERVLLYQEWVEDARQNRLVEGKELVLFLAGRFGLGLQVLLVDDLY
jgi:hypothetical protein